MLYRSEAWPVKVLDFSRLEKNDTRKVRRICNVSSKDRISAEKFRTPLKLKIMRECFQDRKMQWFGHM